MKFELLEFTRVFAITLDNGNAYTVSVNDVSLNQSRIVTVYGDDGEEITQGVIPDEIHHALEDIDNNDMNDIIRGYVE